MTSPRVVGIRSSPSMRRGARRLARPWSRAFGAHPCGHRHRLRSAAVHDPEGGNGHRNAPGVEPDRGRQHHADGRGRCRQRPRERHGGGCKRRDHPQPPVRDASRHRDCRAGPGRPDRGERDARLGAPGGEHHRDPEVPAADRDRHGVRASGMGHAAGRRPPGAHARRIGRHQSGDRSDEPPV